ncbi:Copper amine oxidase N-terminal domain-containing protein [Paenibacillus sp. CF384]|nr:Copper amine oxidase N-terminal domain-containing protein [Paenibacillus sp. CF384]
MKMILTASRLILSLIMIFIISPNSSGVSAQAVVNGSVVLNGSTMELKEKPIVINGSVMIPFRTIFEALGMTVSWDNKAKIVVGKRHGLVIQLGNNRFGFINGHKYELTQSPFLSSAGTFYVNLRFISEASGANVSWDNKNKTAFIQTDPRLNALTLQEFVDFDLLRADWTKKQMEELGLTKEEYGGGATYSNEIVSYAYNDNLMTSAPFSVDIYGSHSGPRGIHVGETFDEVISLFPQHSDWRKNEEGVFYGPTNAPAKHYDIGTRGSVFVYENGNREITLSINQGPFLRIFFEHDVVTHFTFFLVTAAT